MIPFFICLFAILLDRYFGEPRRWRPLVAFAQWANFVESLYYGKDELSAHTRRRRGVAAVAVAVLPLVLVAGLLSMLGPFGLAFDVVVLYLALGGLSLAQHARAVIEPLRRFDLDEARRRVGRIVSHDTLEMDAEAVARATVESVLENGNAAVFAVLFWYLVLGAPGVVMFRLVNTLDAMWGCRNHRYLSFGWAAARLDDVLSWLPARLTALTYTLLGDRSRAWRCWQQQAGSWKNPNARPVMAAGAGALGVSLGGEAHCHGELHRRPQLGEGPAPQPADIERAIAFVQHGQWWWLAAIFILGAM